MSEVQGMFSAEDWAEREWHVRTCPARIAYRPETDCECGGAESHYRDLRERQRRDYDASTPAWWERGG